MGKNKVSKTFTGTGGTWVCPAGTTKVKIVGRSLFEPLRPSSDHGVALNCQGVIEGWGSNTKGALGDSSTTSQTAPSQTIASYQNSRNYLQAIGAKGGSTSYFIGADGRLFSCGANADGQQGDGTVVAKSSPTLVLGGLAWRDAAGRGADSVSTSLGITHDGDCYGWGSNANGCAGLGDTTPRSSPVLTVGGNKFFMVRIGSSGVVCGLKTDGTLLVWGAAANGLGDGTTANKSSPVPAVGVNGIVFTRVMVGNSQAGAISSTNTLYMWGDNSSGQAGLGDTTKRSSPVLVSQGGLSFTDCDGGNSHSIALTTTGDAYCAGSNANGQLGTNNVTNSSTWVAAVGGFKFIRVYAGGNNCWGLTADGKLYGWGDNAGSSIGDGTSTPRSSPTLVTNGFRAKTTAPLCIKEIDVVPNTTYTITMNQLEGTFINAAANLNEAIGENLDLVTLIYDA